MAKEGVGKEYNKAKLGESRNGLATMMLKRVAWEFGGRSEVRDGRLEVRIGCGLACSCFTRAAVQGWTIATATVIDVD